MEGEPLVFEMLVPWEHAPEKDRESARSDSLGSNLAMPLPSCVTLDQPLKLLGPHPYLEIEHDDSSNLEDCCEK